MALSDEDLQKIKAHLAKYPKQRTCPVCESTDWHVTGPHVMPGMRGSGSVGVDTSVVIPVVSLVCNECRYLRTFAWMPIKLGLPRLPRGNV
jgi:hypothetical protein